MLPFFQPRKPTPKKAAKPSLPGIEALEDRCTPTCNLISGYVYQDANNNGVFDPGEVPIANSPIQLRNASGQVVGSTTTSASGYYEFDHDATISTALTTLTKTVTFQNTTTDFALSGLLDRFDPALGQLQAIEITHGGSITSEIKVENFSGTSPSTISGTVGGDLTLVAPGVNHKLTLSQNAGSFNAQVFDGNIDFGGTSGSSFGSKTASNSATFTLTGSDLTPYVGTGQITIQENAKATSSASGGGNIVAQISSTAAATITVVYKYIPSNCLQAGNYTIIQTQQPDGLLDGKDARNNVPLPNSVGADAIAVVLANADLVNNNFGEIVPPQLSGYVYHDANNNGVKGVGEEGIAGVTLTLTGTDDLGPVNKTTTTDANGFYQFLTLRPGNYTVTETQPATWFDGKDAAGSTGGTAGNDVISAIPLAPAAASLNNNFGELKPAELSGYVYVDSNDNGLKEAGEAGISGVTVTLTGTSDRGDAVNVTAATDSSGFYRFANLRPGNYTITETHPSGYDDGKDTAGSQGGAAGNDVISSIALGVGVIGVNNNFGEIRPEIADLTIAKTVGLPSVKVGQQLTYTLTITNLGEFAAKDVVVKDTLPLDATFVTASGAGWTISHAGGIVTATRAALAVNAPTTITVTIVVPAVSNTLFNEATVTATTPDSNPLNNKATVTTPVTTAPPPIAPLATRVAAVPTTSKRQLLSVGGGQASTTARQDAHGPVADHGGAGRRSQAAPARRAAGRHRAACLEQRRPLRAPGQAGLQQLSAPAAERD